MANRKKCFKIYWLAIICISTTGFLVHTLSEISQTSVSYDHSAYSSKQKRQSNTSSNASPKTALSDSITEKNVVNISSVTKSVTTLSLYNITVAENVSTSTKATTEISTNKPTTQITTRSLEASTTEFDESTTQITTQSSTASTTEFDEGSTAISSFQSTSDIKLSSALTTHTLTQHPGITTTPTESTDLSDHFLKIIIEVSVFGTIIVLLLALVIFFCSRLTTKQKYELEEGSEDGWNQMELDGTPLKTNNGNAFKDENVSTTGINSSMPRLSISSPTEMKYATVNQTFATFTPGPEKFRKIRDRNSSAMKTGVDRKGLMCSEPDLLNHTMPSLKLSVKSCGDTLQWEPNVAYQGFAPRIYHSVEDNFIDSDIDDFDDEYYAVIDTCQS